MESSVNRQSEKDNGGTQNRPLRRPGTATKTMAARKTEGAAEPQPLLRPAPQPVPTIARKAGSSQSAFKGKGPVPAAGGSRAILQAQAARPPRSLIPSNAPVRATKQASRVPSLPIQRPPALLRQGVPENGAPRKLLRKSALVVPLASQKRNQSSFNYVAPMVRGHVLPTKSAPSKPVFLALHEGEPVRTPRSKNPRDDTFTTRSAPRMSVANMSVQRRADISPRKAVVSSRLAGETRANDPPSRIVLSPRRSTLASRDSSSEEEVFDNDETPPRFRIPRGLLPLRKTVPSILGKAARKVTSAASTRPLGKAARKRKITTNGPRDEVIELSSDVESDSDIDELLDAFDALTSGHVRLRERGRLPFLLRNLRAGFENRCLRGGVRVYPEQKPQAPVKVAYRYFPDRYDSEKAGDASSSSDEEHQEWVGRMTQWCCPLCQLHQPFRTRDMLVFHLRRDHSDVKVSWSKFNSEGISRWRIALTIPDYDEPSESSSDESDSDSDRDEALIEAKMEHIDAEPSVSRELRKNTASPTTARGRTPLFLPSDSDEELSGLMPIAPPTFADVVAGIKPERPADEESPSTEDTKPILSSSPDSSRFAAPKASYRGTLPNRYPSPPPPTDPLGPAAQYPYLPETNRRGEQIYSCRIGGPRIYDLLNDLPLDAFGIMSWAIVDREEELFEMDDVRDEDKVMLALWNRWIMLNKPIFIFDEYYKGVENFLNQYWELIHKAAGWRALRAFLLMLSVNKYLSFKEVLQALKHYESKTGMDLWYQDEPSPPGESSAAPS
ncbi:hypothetical protein C8Q78DRAFT_1015392 [Trametes maxima]|nr:hypothetical protein C8Q78DRAFT_1015392 [Trametes maxima]